MAKTMFQTGAVNPVATCIFCFKANFQDFSITLLIIELQTWSMAHINYETTLIDFWTPGNKQMATNSLLNRKYMLLPGLLYLSKTRFWTYLLNHLSYRPEIFTQNRLRRPFKKCQPQDSRKIIFLFQKNKIIFRRFLDAICEK